MSSILQHDDDILDGLALAPNGILPDHQINVCGRCHKSLTQKKEPDFSVAKSWIGPLPEQLKGLTKWEEKLLSLYRSCSMIVKLQYEVGKQNSTKQRGFKGNVITFPNNYRMALQCVEQFPAPVSQLVEMIKVHFVGVTLPSRTELKRLMTVRKSKVINAAKWLLENNLWYKGAGYDNSMIEAFEGPDNDIPELVYQTMMHDKDVFLEIDQYPPETISRDQHKNMLPPSVAIGSFIHPEFDKLIEINKANWITKPALQSGILYNTTRSGTLRGPDGTLIEVIEA
jgi:hypothetical protein